MEYTSEQRLEIAQARREAGRTGKPEVIQRINLGVTEGMEFSKLQKIWKPQTVKPEVPVATEVPDAPPKSGKGSGVLAWRAFAKEVSDMDPETIDAMAKTDLISVLEDKGVI